MNRKLPINFAEAYRQYMANIQFQTMTAAEWNLRAPSMNKKSTAKSLYSEAFLAQIQTTSEDTVLDVGCGPGTLALKIAPLVNHVYYIDHSEAMLAFLSENAQKQGIENVTTLHLSKEESWIDKVPMCDVVICSRAGIDADLEQLFLKLNKYARRAVYFSHLVGGHFDQVAISSLLNQTRPPFPDYIYAVNILYQLGFDPNLSFVTAHGRLQDCVSEEDFLSRMQYQYRTLSTSDLIKLKEFYQCNYSLFETSQFGMKWALLNWDV